MLAAEDHKLDFTSYAELAVRLVNTEVTSGTGDSEKLGTIDALRALAAGEAYLAGPCTARDLEALAELRAELAEIFTAAAEADQATAAGRLNALLVRYPLHPCLVDHDRTGWHLHLDPSGSVADRYGAAAVLGLAMIVSSLGLGHLGICAAPGCRGVFADAQPGQPVGYCADHGTPQENVTALPRRARYSASSATG
jgi:hypothetical protein